LSVVAASWGTNGSICRLMMMLSRPKTAMNQGSPAAGIAPVGSSSGKNRSAAVSMMVRW
jgi:hypothetical protein